MRKNTLLVFDCTCTVFFTPVSSKCFVMFYNLRCFQQICVCCLLFDNIISCNDVIKLWCHILWCHQYVQWWENGQGWSRSWQAHDFGKVRTCTMYQRKPFYKQKFVNCFRLELLFLIYVIFCFTVCILSEITSIEFVEVLLKHVSLHLNFCTLCFLKKLFII